VRSITQKRTFSLKRIFFARSAPNLYAERTRHEDGTPLAVSVRGRPRPSVGDGERVPDVVPRGRSDPAVGRLPEAPPAVHPAVAPVPAAARVGPSRRGRLASGARGAAARGAAARVPWRAPVRVRPFAIQGRCPAGIPGRREAKKLVRYFIQRTLRR